MRSLVRNDQQHRPAEYSSSKFFKGRICTRSSYLIRVPPIPLVTRQPCRLARIVADVLPLVRAELRRHNISLQMSLAVDVPPVLAHRVQLQQVLIDLVVTAAEAMREVPTERRRVIIRATPEPAEDHSLAVVTVEDAGVGLRKLGGRQVLRPLLERRQH